MIEDIAEGKEKHRINKKHKVRFISFYIEKSEIPFKKGNLFFPQMFTDVS